MMNPTKVVAAALCALIALTACGSTTEPPAAAPAATTATAAPSPTPAAEWKAGVYKVGDNIQAGAYRTEGDTSQCYWNRLKNDSGENTAIIARDIFSGPGRMTVEPTDAYVKFGGGCRWTRA